MTSGPLSATFPTQWPKPLAAQLVDNLIFLNNFYYAMLKVLTINMYLATLPEQQPIYQGKC